MKDKDLFNNRWVRAFRTEGIIIKRRNFGEADRILTVFTKEHGKLYVKASGVRRITSRRSAHVELLNHSILGLYKGNGFPILTEAKILDDFSSIKSDLDKIGLAYHLCELVDGLCPENQEQYAVFDLLKKTLKRLSLCHSERSKNEAEESHATEVDFGNSGVRSLHSLQSVEMTIPIIVHEFEIELLSTLGYWKSSSAEAGQAGSDLRDAPAYIEAIIERKLKSRSIFSKLQ